MSREMERKGKSRKGADRQARADVHLAPAVELVHSHITKALCEEVFADAREDERCRKWSLFALARFWLAVALEAPPALSHLLARMRADEPAGFLPEVQASSQAFYDRCKSLSSELFASLSIRFMQGVLADAAPG
jgi:hypothetical protein